MKIRLATVVAAAVLAAPAMASDFVGTSNQNQIKVPEEADNRSSVIRHKNGTAPVLKVLGDRGTGIHIDQHNKTATGLTMDSGNASLSVSPSQVAAGLPSNEGNSLSNRETAGMYVKMSGAKLSGDFYFGVDPKTKQFGIYAADGSPVLIVTEQGTVVSSAMGGQE